MKMPQDGVPETVEAAMFSVYNKLAEQAEGPFNFSNMSFEVVQ